MKAATLLLLALLAAASQRTAGAKKKKAQPKVELSCETCVLAVNSIHGRMTEAMRPAGGLADASVEEAVADSLDAACDEVSPASQRRACSDQLMWQISSYVEELFLPTRYEAGNATTGFSEILETLWSGESSTENVVDVYIGYLRKKLKPASDYGFEISTVRHRGFCLEGTPPIR